MAFLLPSPADEKVVADLFTHVGIAKKLGVIVDIGCGTGRYTRWMTAFGERVIGIDASSAALAKATPAEGVEYRRLSLAEAKFKDVDLVVLINVLHFLDASAWGRINAMLRPGGKVLISEPGPESKYRFIGPKAADQLKQKVEALAVMRKSLCEQTVLARLVVGEVGPRGYIAVLGKTAITDGGLSK
jgi:2-polyprenyl-3-methyl-5-hydroxy-6-metoxy-1,4-benzoquinol methylase